MQCYRCHTNNKNTPWQYKDHSYCSLECLNSQVKHDNNTDMMILLKLKHKCDKCGRGYIKKCGCTTNIDICKNIIQSTPIREEMVTVEKMSDKSIFNILKNILE